MNPAEIAQAARAHGRLAIDTEFVSERRYQSQLCLVQTAVDDPDAEAGIQTAVLDPLDEEAAIDFTPLAEVLEDPAVEILVHAGRQDVAILRRTWSCEVVNIFDTQVAAGFLGFGNQEGYEQLVRRVLGVQLKGGEGFTKWDKRPLTERQLAYAADDTRCLLDLASALAERLDERGRLAWAREESRLLEGTDDVRSPQQAYDRLPKLGRLDAKGRAMALALATWRDGIARDIDRPPSAVLPDQTLIELARRPPKDRGALENFRGLPQQTQHRRGAELIAAIRGGHDGEAPPAPESAPKRDPGEAPLVSLAQAVVRHRSRESGVAAELIATQSELSALVGVVRHGHDGERVRALSGWRRELVGGELCDLLEGRRQLAVDADGGLLIEPRG